MSDNTNYNAGDGCEFTHEELVLALPFIDRHGYRDIAVCPFCLTSNADLNATGSALGKMPRAVFVRCANCNRVYFRPDAQEPALAKTPMRRSFLNYLLWAVIMPMGVFLGGYLLFSSEGALAAAIVMGVISVFLACMMGLFIRDMCASDDDILQARKRLESSVYLAALRDRGVKLPYCYLRQLEKDGESAESSH